MSIPPLILNGQATCPDGFALSPDGTQCLPISPPIKVDVTGVSAQEIDPSIAARLAARGWSLSGIIERAVTAHATIPLTIGRQLVAGLASLYDGFLALCADFMEQAQGQANPQFYKLAAALMEDLLGNEVDGDKLADVFISQGRVAAMEFLGKSLFSTLSGEFAGVAQRASGNTFTVPLGEGIGGLPVKEFGPGDGIRASERILGYVTSFAIREGNTDAFAEACDNPYLNPFRILKDFGEDFSKSLGLGRLLRVALRPLVQTMVADPLQADLNTQYRPKLLDPGDAIRAWKIGALSDDELKTELAMSGFSDKRITALKADKSKPLAFHEYATLRAARPTLPEEARLSDDAIAQRLAVSNYDLPTVQGWFILSDLDPARKLSLAYVEHYVQEYLQGRLTFQAIKLFLDKAARAKGVLLTPGEVDGLESLVDSVAENLVTRPRHLSFAQLQLAYIDGTITLDELEAHLTALGYVPADITVLVLETLIKAKQHAAAAAKKAATGKGTTPTPGSTAAPTPGA